MVTSTVVVVVTIETGDVREVIIIVVMVKLGDAYVMKLVVHVVVMLFMINVW